MESRGVPPGLKEFSSRARQRNKQLLAPDTKEFGSPSSILAKCDNDEERNNNLLADFAQPTKNIQRMKLDLLLEYRDGTVLIAWARETSLGVYMGVRFSPGVENTSYFKDGRRQLLHFPSTPEGKRKREEILLAPQSPIASIHQSELILSRVVDLSGDRQPTAALHQSSAGTTEFTVSGDFLEDRQSLCYEAHLVRNEYCKAFVSEAEPTSSIKRDDKSLIRLFPLCFSPEHSLALIIRGKRPLIRIQPSES